MIRLSEYLNVVESYRRDYPAWRRGQVYFNALFDFDPKVAEEVRATAIDTFNRDEAIPDLLEHLVWRLKQR
jgi:hypothetical protein